MLWLSVAASMVMASVDDAELRLVTVSAEELMKEADLLSGFTFIKVALR